MEVKSPKKWADESYLVPTVTLDQTARQLGTNPHVIKMDVAGAELAVLKGADMIPRQAKPKIFLSTHSADMRSACLEYLGERYSFEVLSQDKNDPSEFLAIWSGI